MTKSAIVNYSTLIRLKPESVDAYFNRARIFEQRNELSYAEEDFKQVRTLDPSNEDAVFNQAMSAFRKKLWIDCLVSFKKLQFLDPDNSDYHVYKGRVNANMGRFTEAFEVTRCNIGLFRSNCDQSR